jgi:hypothetical protein
MKQTGVKYLVETIKYYMSLEISLDTILVTRTIEQAEKMEQEHIINAFNEGNESDWSNEAGDGGEQYYNETFKSE